MPPDLPWLPVLRLLSHMALMRAPCCPPQHTEATADRLRGSVVNHHCALLHCFLLRAGLTEASEHMFSSLLSDRQIKTVIHVKLYIFCIRPSLVQCCKGLALTAVKCWHPTCRLWALKMAEKLRIKNSAPPKKTFEVKGENLVACNWS